MRGERRGGKVGDVFLNLLVKLLKIYLYENVKIPGAKLAMIHSKRI